jgi:hypothetical protein
MDGRVRVRVQRSSGRWRAYFAHVIPGTFSELNRAFVINRDNVEEAPEVLAAKSTAFQQLIQVFPEHRVLAYHEDGHVQQLMKDLGVSFYSMCSFITSIIFPEIYTSINANLNTVCG